MQVFLYGRAGSRENYREALERVGLSVCVSEAVEEARACEGLLLSGGGDIDPVWYGQKNVGSRGIEPSFDLAELFLTLDFARRGCPILGICRGLQVINVGFGGTLQQDIGGHSGDAEGDMLHRTLATGCMEQWYGRCPIVNSYHHQAIDCLGEGLCAIQWAEDGTIEAISHRCLPILAVQWHPERLMGRFARQETVDGTAIFEWFTKKLKKR